MIYDNVPRTHTTSFHGPERLFIARVGKDSAALTRSRDPGWGRGAGVGEGRGDASVE